MELEWDDAKAKLNLERHGVDFEDAAGIFLDVLRIEDLDRREDYGEPRCRTIGVVEGRTLVVVYTERDCVLRVISARRATRSERRAYENASRLQ